MKRASRIILIAAAALLAAGCGSSKKVVTANPGGFPKVDQGGKIAIVAHRGFWKSDEAKGAQNSIAALKAAQDYGFWGIEFDIQLTSDNVVIVNHDNDISIDGESYRIWTTPYSTLVKKVLSNGEHPSTIDQFLDQGAKCATTMLVCEFKTQKDTIAENILIEKTIASLKKHKIFSPDRVMFISFSRHACDVIAAQYPQFINQYLTGKDPDEIVDEGINGLDYHYSVFFEHNDWLDKAREYGMTTNIWTVDKANDIQKSIDLNVGAITTNQPLLVREMLGDKEFKLK